MYSAWEGIVSTACPIAARIVTLADAYDAITSDRPYKAASGHPEAVRRISVDRGEHFDPVLVDTFLACQGDFDRIRRDLRPPTPTATAKTVSPAVPTGDEVHADLVPD